LFLIAQAAAPIPMNAVLALCSSLL
jgi:hypothetical protein